MDTLTRYEAWYGRDEPPPKCIALRAGPLTVEFEAGDLRYIRLGSRELVRRIYVAIRDHNWNTIPGALSDVKVEAAEDHFSITFGADHRAGPLEYAWRATITGASDGTITYAMDGVAGSAFRYNRIGFCVLHPIRECAGRPYRAQTPAGPIAGELPRLIGPQTMVNGFEAPLFPSCSELVITLEDGLELTSAFEGDLFEMEDQRNWTDGSFKTYCTPLALGYPHAADKGQVVHQQVRISVAPLPGETRGSQPAAGAEDAWLALGEPLGHGLPKLGFGLASDSAPLTAREVSLLSAACPAHLKAELHFQDPHWPAELQKALDAARQVGTRLELALFLGDDGTAALSALREHLTAGAASPALLARVLVFHEAEAGNIATPGHRVAQVRDVLGASFQGVPIGGGTNGNFAELNRSWPDTSPMAGLSYTINPQVHATDERSLVEALDAQESTLATCRAHCGALPIWVSSVTLKPPFNQAATEAEGPADANELPASVDPRQMSLFGAAWTVGSLRALTAGGADSVTYYETTGWRGLIEGPEGSRLPERFRSWPGMVFPVYHVFADLAEGAAAGAEAVAALSSHPLRVQGLALAGQGHLYLLVANLLAAPQRVTVGPLPAGWAALRRLNESTAPIAMCEPDRFRRLRDEWPFSGGLATLAMGPYETVHLEIVEASR